VPDPEFLYVCGALSGISEVQGAFPLKAHHICYLTINFSTAILNVLSSSFLMACSGFDSSRLGAEARVSFEEERCLIS